MCILWGMNDWYEYVVQTAGTTSQTKIEADTGISQSTLAKWKSGTRPSPAQVAKFAREKKVSVLDAFVVAEFLTPDEAGVRATGAPRLSESSEGQLVAEVAKRLGVKVEVQPPKKKEPRPLAIADEKPGKKPPTAPRRQAKGRR